jgi:hypothetical protein
MDEAKSIISGVDCCARDENGEFVDAPINVVLIGEGIDLLRSLLRGNWQNLSREQSAHVTPSFLFGRKQDAIFRYTGTVNKGYYQLRLWRSRMLLEGDLVWAGQIQLIIDNAWSITRPDPDVDVAREFLLQNMWYSQSLSQFATSSGIAVLPVESLWANIIGRNYFTDGMRTIMWLSGDPVSITETTRLDWGLPGEAGND